MKKILIVTILLLINYVGFTQIKNSKSKDIYTEVQKFIKNKQWKQAEQNLNTLLKLYPNSAVLYFKRGYVLEMDLRYEECIRDFSKAISLKPEMRTARTNRGFAYRKLGEYEKAITDFTAEITVNPSAYSYEHRSLVYYLSKDYEKALIDINKSIDQAPKNPIAYKTRALIYKAIDFKEKACKDRQKAMKLKILKKYPKYKTDISQLKIYCKS
ncbi:tetratricopeptide repeat protein [uncultured Aquimarina sp.]|uniref:tetratricopeptide repeat protein n=1 Tax=uncultured Aquimarina sp. TaxID=575652 RepID=UPI00260C4ADF|nr:tetratricopeptide repeat protein [uncultured Aquimarina sp.]